MFKYILTLERSQRAISSEIEQFQEEFKQRYFQNAVLQQLPTSASICAAVYTIPERNHL
jgi:hypothetical protein